MLYAPNGNECILYFFVYYDHRFVENIGNVNFHSYNLIEKQRSNSFCLEQRNKISFLLTISLGYAKMMHGLNLLSEEGQTLNSF